MVVARRSNEEQKQELTSMKASLAEVQVEADSLRKQLQQVTTEVKSALV